MFALAKTIARTNKRTNSYRYIYIYIEIYIHMYMYTPINMCYLVYTYTNPAQTQQREEGAAED